MTLNMRHGLGLDGNVDLERVAQLIESENVDIVGLNEVDKSFSKRSSYMNQAEWIAKRLGFYYVFGPTISINLKHKREYGNMIASKYPILKYHNHIFRLRAPISEPRAILEATVTLENKSVAVFAGHFSINPVLNDRMASFLANRDSSVSPSIIMGDFNRKPRSRFYQKMIQKYRDCCGLSGENTFPAKKPRSRIDYIFVSDHFDVCSSHVVPSDVSDHLPVCAQLRL